MARTCGDRRSEDGVWADSHRRPQPRTLLIRVINGATHRARQSYRRPGGVRQLEELAPASVTCLEGVKPTR